MQILAADVMPARCHGCAFTDGTPANRDAITSLTKELCLVSGEPFFCHANAVQDRLPDGQCRICCGFAEEQARRPVEPAWKAAIAAESLRILEESETRGEIPPEEVNLRISVAAGIVAR